MNMGNFASQSKVVKKGTKMARQRILSIFIVGLFFCGCQGVYYNTMEALGHHKREILVERVENSRDAQQEAKEQFESALEQFKTVVDFSGGDLEKIYKQLKTELEKSESKASSVKSHIRSVEDVGDALFKEWEKELEQYSNEKLRRASESKLEQTKSKYIQLIEAMKRAEEKIEPVLIAFRDQVLFLKHNLNAQAVASLHDELILVEADIASLIKEMEASIAEADAFINSMVTE